MYTARLFVHYWIFNDVVVASTIVAEDKYRYTFFFYFIPTVFLLEYLFATLSTWCLYILFSQSSHSHFPIWHTCNFCVAGLFEIFASTANCVVWINLLCMKCVPYVLYDFGIVSVCVCLYLSNNWMIINLCKFTYMFMTLKEKNNNNLLNIINITDKNTKKNWIYIKLREQIFNKCYDGIYSNRTDFECNKLLLRV